MELRQQLELLADLSMAAQGFRPAPARLAILISEGLMWVYPSKPPIHGLTQLGKATFLSLLCEGAEMDPVDLATAIRQFIPSMAEFSAGSAFLDTLEAEARSGKKVLPSPGQALFAVWLVQQLPPPPPSPAPPEPG